MKLSFPASASYAAVTVVGILLSLIFYVILLRTTQGLTKEDMTWLSGLVREPKAPQLKT